MLKIYDEENSSKKIVTGQNGFGKVYSFIVLVVKGCSTSEATTGGVL